MSTPVTGPAGIAGGTYGQVAANAATTASIAYVSQQRMVGKATNVDVAVTGVTAGIGQIPIVGVAGGFLQLGWDLIDPFHSY